MIIRLNTNDSTSFYFPFIPHFILFLSMSYEILLLTNTGDSWKKIQQFDRRLASIFDQAFAECHNLESFFKFTWMIGYIANRPIIMTQLWHNYEEMIQKVDDYLSHVKVTNIGIQGVS